MHKFDGEFAEFFDDPIIRQLLAKDAEGHCLLFALKEEKERLWDVERFRAFRRALSHNPHLLRGKVVLTLRSGLGLTAIWPARAGAARVICVENSPAIEFIRERVKLEGLNNVSCVQGAPEELGLQPDSVDVLVADWPGYFGVNQPFIYELIRVRELCLRPGGAVLPDRLSFSAACFADEAAHRERFGFWDSVYDFAMPSMKSVCFGEAVFERVDPRCLVSHARTVKTLDLATATPADLAFRARATLELRRRPAVVHGLALWFDVAFTRCHVPLELRSSPFKSTTDVSNVRLFFRRPVRVEGHEHVHLTLTVSNLSENVSQTRVDATLALEGSDYAFSQSFLMK